MAGETVRETETRFNPAVPDVQEEGARVNRLLNISRGIQQPKAPESLAYSLEGAGKALEEGAKGFHYAMERGIQDSARPRIEATREEFENRLDAARRAQEENITAGGPKPTSAASLLSPTPTAQEVPGDLKNIDRQAKVNDLARANGKITETDYYARMDTLRKEYVNRYPGFTDFVDSTFEKYTGFNSANKLIASKIADYNALVAAQKEKANKDQDYLRTHSASMEPGEYEMYSRALKAGVPGEAVIDKANRNLRQKFQYEQEIARANATEKNTGVQRDKIYQLSVTRGTQMASDAIEGTVWEGGKTISQMLDEHLRGNIVPEPGQAEAWANVMKATEERTVAKWYAEQRRPLRDEDPASPTYGQLITSAQGIMGPKTKEAEAEIRRPFEDYIGLIRNEKFGLAFQAARDLKAQVDGTADKIINDPEYGGYTAMKAAVFKLFGTRQAALDAALDTMKIVPKIEDQEKIQALVDRTVSGLPYRTEQDPSGIYSFKRGITNASKDGAAPESIDAYLKIADWIEDPKKPDAVKRNLIKALYSHYDAGMMSALAADEPVYDANGNQIGTKRGRESFFHDATSEGKLKEVYRLSQTDKKLWEDAKNWVGSEGAYLYKKDVIDINQAVSRGYQIGYDDVAHKFILQKTGNPAIDARRQYVEDKLGIINDLIRPMATIARLEGNEQGINDTIRNYLSSPGFRGGAADVLLQAITHSRHPLTAEDKAPSGIPGNP